MKTIHLFILFVLVALIQLFVPAQMIFNQENTLEDGTAYKFKTQPIDPTDPFRGKYITLRYEIDSYPTKDSIWERQQDVFVYLKTDSLGFAKIDQVSKTMLDTNSDYITAKVRSYSTYQDVLRIHLPFDRFYMKETKAKDAEIAHRNAQRDSLPNNTYALVFVKDGASVLDNVFINDIPISDYVVK
ncbi:GDYXXLXY domain-containing protein [Lacinutrix sp. MEBiC02595]